MAAPCLELLPPELMAEIMSYLTFDNVALLRQVCRSLDRAARYVLNSGFLRAQCCIQNAIKQMRVMLPRRESARHRHPLGRRVEHLSAIDTRLGLLDITYTRYINSGACCFIPGKVLDELFSMFHQVMASHDVEDSTFVFLRELRDISSMAMEHFNEQIAPKLCSQSIRQRPSSLSMMHRLNGSSPLPECPDRLSVLSRPLAGRSGLFSILAAAASVVTSSPRSSCNPSSNSSTPSRDSQSLALPTLPSGDLGRLVTSQQKAIVRLNVLVTSQKKAIVRLSGRVLKLERRLTLQQNCRRRLIQRAWARRRVQYLSSEARAGSPDLGREQGNVGEESMPVKRRRL